MYRLNVVNRCNGKLNCVINQPVDELDDVVDDEVLVSDEPPDDDDDDDEQLLFPDGWSHPKISSFQTVPGPQVKSYLV